MMVFNVAFTLVVLFSLLLAPSNGFQTHLFHGIKLNSYGSSPSPHKSNHRFSSSSAVTNHKQRSSDYLILSSTRSAVTNDNQEEAKKNAGYHLRDKLRQATGFSLTAFRSTWRAATGISLTAVYASALAASGLWIRKVMSSLLSIFPAWVGSHHLVPLFSFF